MDWLSASDPPVWVVVTTGGKTKAQSREAKEPKGSLAEKIVDGLSIEAYGAKREGLPTAKDWSKRYTADEREPGAADSNLVYESEDAASLLERSSGRAQVAGEWTLQQLAPDPTGELIAGVMNLSTSVPVSVAHGINPQSQIALWLEAKLSPRELAVQYLDQLGYSDAQIGHACRRLPVRRWPRA